MGDLGLELLKSNKFHVETKTRIFRTNFMQEFMAHIHKLVGDKKEMLAHFFVEANVEQHIEDVLNEYESEVKSIGQQIMKEMIADASYETERDYFKGINSVYLSETYGESYINKAKINFMLAVRAQGVNQEEIITQNKMWASATFNRWLTAKTMILII